MQKAILIRLPDNHIQTIGMLKSGNFSCDTMELAWKNNESNVSCIPTGVYICKWTRSNRLSKLKGVDVFTYEVMNVPNRGGIRIHSASFFHDLLGCISLGVAAKDLDGDGSIDLIDSRKTIAEFNALMNKEDFELTIQ